MKKVKNIGGIVKDLGILEEFAKIFSKRFNLSEEEALKAVNVRFENALAKVGQKLQNNQFNIKEGDINTKLSEMSIDDIINSDNIIKDK